MMKHLSQIVEEELEYVDTYIKHKKGEKILHPRKYAREYGYSTLSYFDSILGI